MLWRHVRRRVPRVHHRCARRTMSDEKKGDDPYYYKKWSGLFQDISANRYPDYVPPDMGKYDSLWTWNNLLGALATPVIFASISFWWLKRPDVEWEKLRYHNCWRTIHFFRVAADEINGEGRLTADQVEEYIKDEEAAEGPAEAAESDALVTPEPEGAGDNMPAQVKYMRIIKLAQYLEREQGEAEHVGRERDEVSAKQMHVDQVIDNLCVEFARRPPHGAHKFDGYMKTQVFFFYMMGWDYDSIQRWE